MIEAKVESQPGKAPTGYSQDKVQEALCRLMPAVSPYRACVSRLGLAASKILSSSAATIPWSAVADLAAKTPHDEHDEFTRRGLKRFAEPAPTGRLSKR